MSLLRPGRVTRRCAAGFSAGLVFAAGGCSAPLSTVDPAGGAAEAIALLWWIMLAGATVIFLGVMAVALYALRQRRAGYGVSERGLLIGGGLVFPSVVLMALLIGALLVGDRLAPRGGDVVNIEARAEQWEWRFAYPDRPGSPVTTGVLHIPAGRPFEVTVTSADVIHSFWIPRIGGKIDAIPGHANRIRLQAGAPGDYLGQCAEYCGVGHTGMGFVLRVHPPEAFDAALDDALAGETP